MPDGQRNSHPGRELLTSPSPDRWTQLRRRVVEQSNYLRNPLPAGAGICSVCRGPVTGGYARCFVCHEHRRAASGRTCDVVVPIAYGIRGEQHYQNLVAYKAKPPAFSAQTRLRDLTLLFLRDHWACLTEAAGGRFTHLAVVPSTSGRPGPHPLTALVAAHVPLPSPDIRVNPAYSPDDRAFHVDRFRVRIPAGDSRVRVLIMDDTWTTGCRVQSLAYALKDAGAVAVTAVVVGRLVRPDYQPSRPLLARVADYPFDLSRCCIEGCSA